MSTIAPTTQKLTERVTRTTWSSGDHTLYRDEVTDETGAVVGVTWSAESAWTANVTVERFGGFNDAPRVVISVKSAREMDATATASLVSEITTTSEIAEQFNAIIARHSA